MPGASNLIPFFSIVLDLQLNWMPKSNESISRPITSYYHYVRYVCIYKEILIWNKIPILASGWLKSCHEIQVYLYFPRWVQLTAGCISAYQKLHFPLVFTSTVHTFSNTHCKKTSVWMTIMSCFHFTQKQKQPMSIAFVLSKYMIGPYFKTSSAHVNMHCKAHRWSEYMLLLDNSPHWESG